MSKKLNKLQGLDNLRLLMPQETANNTEELEPETPAIIEMVGADGDSTDGEENSTEYLTEELVDQIRLEEQNRGTEQEETEAPAQNATADAIAAINEIQSVQIQPSIPQLTLEDILTQMPDDMREAFLQVIGAESDDEEEAVVEDPRKYELIDKLLEYEIETNHQRMAEHYDKMSVSDLEAALASWEKSMGDPAGVRLLREVAERIKGAEKNPITQRALELFEHRRVSHIELLQRLEKSLGSNSTFKSLIAPDYHETARLAIQENLLMRDLLMNVINTTSLVKIDKNASLKDIMVGVRHLWAHFQVNHDKIGRFSKQIDVYRHDKEKAEERTRDQIKRIDEMAMDNRARVDAIMSSLVPLGDKCYISFVGMDKMLADRNYVRKVREAIKEGRNPKMVVLPSRISYKDLVWVRNPEEALAFDNPEKARLFLEEAMEVIHRRAKSELVSVNGVPLADIRIAVKVLYHTNGDLSV